jgi:hypothetical protein
MISARVGAALSSIPHLSITRVCSGDFENREETATSLSTFNFESDRFNAMTDDAKVFCSDSKLSSDRNVSWDTAKFNEIDLL